MKLTVIGIGYVGLTHAVCMAYLGHEVLAIDIDTSKVGRAARGETPFFDPGLEPLLIKMLESGRLRFTTSFAEVGGFGDMHFICVGTPQADDGSADLRHVYSAVDALAPYLDSRCLVVGKSTVPVGTARALGDLLASRAPAGESAEIAWNPEFLREGRAVEDSLSPDRLVFGVTSSRQARLLRRVYARLLTDGVQELVMDLETAELVKVAANAFLALKISYINAMAEVCEAVGADIISLADALSRDPRIGPDFLSPGLGFGGSCLPKDIRAFGATAAKLGIESVSTILREVDEINIRRRVRTVDLVRVMLGGTVAGSRVAALGVAFKANSDDVRDSAGLDVCDRLAAEGASVKVYDPAAMVAAARVRPELCYAESAEAAATGADLVIVLTEWDEFRCLDPGRLGQVVTHRNMIDTRCIIDERRWSAAGWTCRTLGRQ